jgi:nucleotide-binding universal stress UspA family protein
MSDTQPFPLSDETQVLLPVLLPDPEPVSRWLRSFLQSVDIYLLGCYDLPEQTSPEQGRNEFEDEASETLADVAAEFREFSRDVETRLVFTPDVVQSIEREAEDRNVDAIVRPRPVDRIESLLGVLTREVNYGGVVKCISAMTGEDVQSLKLIQIDAEDGHDEEQSLILEGVESRLVDRGVAPEVIETESIVTDEQTDRVMSEIDAVDLVIVAEEEPTLTGRHVGTIAEYVFREADVPVVFVRLGSDS